MGGAAVLSNLLCRHVAFSCREIIVGFLLCGLQEEDEDEKDKGDGTNDGAAKTKKKKKKKKKAAEEGGPSGQVEMRIIRVNAADEELCVV